jgi:DNA-binding NarL/FixJ family response regulator
VLADLLRPEGYETFSALNGKIALKEISTHSPDLILLDIRLPGIDGMTLLEKVKEIDSRILIIMLTGHGDIKDAVRAIKLGAADYITKPFDNDEMITAINKALRTSAPADDSPASNLSLREKEVLLWVKNGKNNWEISKILNISERTVFFHVGNIMEKVDATSRTHAVVIAMEQGIINKE